jgi:hypothetical protein
MAGSTPASILSVIAGGMLLVAMVAFLVVPVHAGGADCGTLFTSSDEWVSLSADGPEPEDVQVICHDGHTSRLVGVIALGISALALLALPATRLVRTHE